MNIKAQDLINLMDEWAPAALAESWDHPGLQVGNPEEPVKKVMISLDLTEQNVDRACREGVSMIISHHPFLFKSLHRIDLSTIREGSLKSSSAITSFPLRLIRIWTLPEKE